MTTTKTAPNPASLVFESEQAALAAAEAYQKANAVAIEAQRIAAEAQANAERERHERMTSYLEQLSAAYPTEREKLTIAVGDARQELEAAIRDGGDVVQHYLGWVRAAAGVHALETELTEIRNMLGHPARWPSDLHFSFAHDVGAIIDGVSMEAVDDALNAARDRRIAYVSGAKSD